MLNNSDTAMLLPATTMEDPKSKEFSLRHMINRSLESFSDEEDKENKEITMAVSSDKKKMKKKKKLIIKMPTLGDHHQFNASVLDMNVDDDDQEGYRTPTSSDKKIPVMISPKCPPPPRKPKSISLSSSSTTTTTPNYKRKTPSSSPSSKMNLPCRCRCRIRISDEDIKALFPPTFLADLGRKIKKARSTSFN